MNLIESLIIVLLCYGLEFEWIYCLRGKMGRGEVRCYLVIFI